MKYATADWAPKGHRATWCHRVTEISESPSEGNNHGNQHNQQQQPRASEFIQCNDCTDGDVYDQQYNFQGLQGWSTTYQNKIASVRSTKNW